MSSTTSKSAYIDKSGKTVIDASRYETAGDFSDGLAPVEVPRRGWGCIDKTGALAISPKFESTLDFKEGLAPVLVGGKWGFTVESWNLADRSRDTDQSAESEFLVIDNTGQILANLDQKRLSVDIDDARFSEGLLPVFSQEKKAKDAAS